MSNTTPNAGAGILFLNAHRQVLLFLRDDKPGIPYPNRWDILGGHIEPGESPAECIAREMREEIGYAVRGPKLYTAFFSEMDQTQQYIFWERAEFDLKNVTLHEGQRLKWFTLDELEAMDDDAFGFGFAGTIRAFLRNPPDGGGAGT